MNKILGITAILTIAIFASGALAATVTTGTVPAQVYVPAATCGASTGGTSFNFGTLARGAISGDGTVTVTTSGDSPATIYLYGDNWNDGTNYAFGVGQTHWWPSNPAGNYAGMTPLKLVGAADSLGSISSGSSFTHYFELQIPAGAPAGTFYQTITYEADC